MQQNRPEWHKHDMILAFAAGNALAYVGWSHAWVLHGPEGSAVVSLHICSWGPYSCG